MIIQIGNNYSTIVWGDISKEFQLVSDACSFNYSYFGYNFITRKPERKTKRFCYLKNSKFPTGLAGRIINRLVLQDIKVQLVDQRNEILPSRVEYKFPLPLRYYQDEAAAKAIEATRGIVKMPTRSGKSWVIQKIIFEIGALSIIMVNGIDLLYQFYDDMIKNCDKKLVGLIGDGEEKIRRFNVATAQTLNSRKDKKSIKSLLQKNQVFIADECLPGSVHISAGKGRVSYSLDSIIATKLMPLIDTFNTKLNRIEQKPILKITPKGRKQVFKLTFEDELGNRWTLRCTDNHKLYNPISRGYFKVSDLKIGDYVFVQRDRKHHNYYVNESFFSVIDNEEKAYWLGFLAADGHIREDKVYLGLSNKDREHLVKFCRAIGSNFPIDTYYKNMNNKLFEKARTVIQSNKLVRDLVKSGLKSDKTFSLTFPNNLEDSLIRHWIRGYFDGNGSISIREKYHNFMWGFTSTENVCIGARNWLRINTGLELPNNVYHKKKHDNRIFKLQVHGNKQIANIVRLIYTNSTVFLDRKYQVAKELL